MATCRSTSPTAGTNQHHSKDTTKRPNVGAVQDRLTTKKPIKASCRDSNRDLSMNWGESLYRNLAERLIELLRRCAADATVFAGTHAWTGDVVQTQSLKA